MRLGIAAATIAVAGLAGCGGGDEEGGTIPPESSRSLLEQLEGIRTAIEDDNCTTARTDATQFVDEVNALPEQTGLTLKEQLREAGQNLNDLVISECEDTGATGETGPVDETTTTTAPPVTPAAPVDEPPPVETDEGPPEQPPGEGGGPPSGGGGNGDSGGVGDEKGKRGKRKPSETSKRKANG